MILSNGMSLVHDLDHKYRRRRVRFVSRVEYPSPAANGLQTIQMAAAFARVTGDCRLFIHSLKGDVAGLVDQYGVQETPLEIVSGGVDRWPEVIRKCGLVKFILYNSAVAARLCFRHPTGEGERNVLFARSRLELNYWGLLRPYLPWFRKWRFVYESHDLETGRLGTSTQDSARLRRAMLAMRRFDLVVAITDALAKDICDSSGGIVRPQVVTLSSALERLDAPPKVDFFGKDPIVLGYIGTVDRMRGLHVLLEALPMIQAPVQLKIVGRIPGADGNRYPEWLAALLARPEISSRIEITAPVPYKAVAARIDACDIVLLPAGVNEHASKYAAPLKLFDYMVRGKPIVAAGVDCHRELLTDRVNALIYDPNSPESAARAVASLAEDRSLASRVALGAWEDSEQYTYDARARRILDLVESC